MWAELVANAKERKVYLSIVEEAEVAGGSFCEKK